MDTLKIYMFGKSESVDIRYIIEIKDGMALTASGRWHKIDCDCLESENYETVPDSEAPNGNGYIICNRCNRVHYLQDLRNVQENI